jgi:predicted deacylase
MLPPIEMKRLTSSGVGFDLCQLGDRDGPVLSVLGGVHGDELEGVAAVRLLFASLRGERVRGTLRGVAVANELAFAARSRTTPEDGGNLARSFPGRADGGPTERVADLLTRSVIAGSSLLVDLHSAGRDYSMPWFAGWVDDATESARRAGGAAMGFGAPTVWAHDGCGPGRSLSAAMEHGVPAIYVECGGGAALRRRDVHGYVDGVRRLMVSLGMLDGEAAVPSPVVLRGGAGDVDASLACSSGGWCMTAVEAGDGVRRGSLVAEIAGPDGTVVEQLTAPVDGTVMMLRRRAEVAAGDSIAMLGPTPVAPR